MNSQDKDVKDDTMRDEMLAKLINRAEELEQCVRELKKYNIMRLVAYYSCTDMP